MVLSSDARAPSSSSVMSRGGWIVALRSRSAGPTDSDISYRIVAPIHCFPERNPSVTRAASQVERVSGVFVASQDIDDQCQITASVGPEGERGEDRDDRSDSSR